jgi:hypothetical protein
VIACIEVKQNARIVRRKKIPNLMKMTDFGIVKSVIPDGDQKIIRFKYWWVMGVIANGLITN